jgi:hypothetical protein
MSFHQTIDKRVRIVFDILPRRDTGFRIFQRGHHVRALFFREKKLLFHDRGRNRRRAMSLVISNPFHANSVPSLLSPDEQSRTDANSDERSRNSLTTLQSYSTVAL